MINSTTIFGLELVLNDRTILVMTDKELKDFTGSKFIENDYALLYISELFPWLEEINNFESISGSERIDLTEEEITEDRWNKIQIISESDTPPELHVDEKILIGPERISVSGKVLKIPQARIWTAGEFPYVQESYKTIGVFRKFQIIWNETNQPEFLLANPPEGKRPHLLFISDVDLIPLKKEIQTYVGFKILVTEPKDGHFYSPDITLHWILNDSDGVLENFMKIKNFFPSISKYLFSIESEGDWIKVIRYIYAVIPKGLSPGDFRIAQFLLRDTQRNGIIPEDVANAKPIPMTSKVTRYFEAYDRLGRLVFTNQLNPDDALLLINGYVLNPQDL